MTNIAENIPEDIRTTLVPALKVYDREGTKVGEISDVDHETGYFLVETGTSFDVDSPFVENQLYVPFRLITNIDPRELYVSVTRDQLHRECADPPARATVVRTEGGEEVATTTEASGYDGAPIVVEEVSIDSLESRIAVGVHVYTTDMTDLGTIKRYDPATGWMLIEKGVRPNQHDLMLPVTLFKAVNPDTNTAYLAVSRADLRRIKHGQPADVVFPEVQARDGG